jgi:four helix bundle protein
VQGLGSSQRLRGAELKIEADRKTSLPSYQGLLVWQKAMDLVAEIYCLAQSLPAREVCGLTSQMQRAAVSIRANIAEGYGRHHLGDYLHHISVVNGSLKELETHILIAQRLSFLRADQCGSAMKLSDEIGRMLGALAQGLRRKSPSANSRT